MLCCDEDMIQEMARLGGKLDHLHQELRDMEENLAEFLEDYYGKVGPYLTHLEQLNRNHPENKEDSPANTVVPEAKHAHKETRELYLFLVKRHHPDRAESSASDALIRQLNSAYRQKQPGSLWHLAFSEELTSVAAFPPAFRMRLFHHYQERMQQMIATAEQRVQTLQASEEYQLWLRTYTARLRGEDLLREITCQMQQEISRRIRRLEYQRFRERLKREANLLCARAS